MNWFARKKDMWRVSKITRDGDLIGTQLFRANPSCHKKDFPYLLYFTLSYSGTVLPNHDDFAQYNEVESIFSQVESELGIEIIGVMTMNGKRDWIMYAKNGQKAVDGLFREMSKYHPHMTTTQDPRWRQYQDLKNMK